MRLLIVVVCTLAIGCARASPSAGPAAGALPIAGLEAPAGCETPTNAPRHAYYVDPSRGSAAGDGSKAHPWVRLQDVLAAKMSSIHGGDVIYLASGDHGAVAATADNSKFVEVTAEPGQHPVLRSLSVTGARWVFSRLKIQSTRSEGGGVPTLVYIHKGASAANNIILDDNVISAADDVSTWSPSDWLKNGMAGIKVEGGDNGTTCVSITHNAIKATGGATHAGAGAAIMIYADRSLVADNTIDHFADDAIEYGANDLVIKGNRITNSVGVEDSNHNDAMQGFVPGGGGYAGIHAYRHIVIDGNLIVRQTDPSLRDPAALQGIDNFSAAPTDWYDLKVINNVVITNAYHGITFGSVHHGIIAHNTVLADGGATSERQIIGGKETTMTLPGDRVWIMVTDRMGPTATPGGPTSDVVVEDNISSVLQVLASGAHARHNLALDLISLPAGGKLAYYKNPGEYGDHNLLDPTAVDAFTAWRPATHRFDLSLRHPDKLGGRGSPLHVSVNP